MIQTAQPVIALISAVPTAIPPTQSAFRELFPNAILWNVLDDRLLEDSEGVVTASLAARMRRLIDHTVRENADAVLLTCSMYASVARDVAAEVDQPVLGADDALFSGVAKSSYRRLALVSPAADQLADSLARMRPIVGADVAVEGVIAEGAVAFAQIGDVAALVEAISHAVKPISSEIDAIILGQYSLAPAASGVEAALRVPTLAGPQYSARALRALIDGNFT